MTQVSNKRIEEARDYHAATKHSYWSVRSGSHGLDWENRPLPFKIYPDLPVVPLPRDIGHPAMAALDAVAGFKVAGKKELDLRLLAELLFFCAGLTKKKIYPGGEEHHFRAAACTGALYEVEVYAVCGPVPGLNAGVYHFSPADFALRRLRDGDYRGELVRASAGDRAISHAPVTLVLTAIAWRNAWKYRARAYRHFFWNSGTMLANLLATAFSEGIASRVVLGFLDARIDRLLGIDGEREVSLCLVPLGSNAAAPEAREVGAISPKTVPLSRKEIEYPQIGRLRTSSALASDGEVRTWRAAFESRPSPPSCETRYPLDSSGGTASSVRTVADVILRRGSTRRFARAEITFVQLSTILDRSTRGMPADFLDGPGTTLIDTYLVANAVAGLPSGAYYFSREGRALELLREGAFRREAGYLCLEQELGADASAVVFFLADLEWVLKRYGNRGYGAAQLEAGVVGGKLYLCAYALGLGATGTTFYDDDVTAFFSPHAHGKAPIFAVALGRASRAPGRVQLLKPGEH
jgi:SagB-type dehydrogenase family enzyme